MNLYDRYLNGECEQVYEEINALGPEAFLPSNIHEIESVLTETFTRVSYNAEIVFQELKKINYRFNTNPEYHFEKPLHKPLPNTSFLLEQLDQAVSPFGFVPQSLKYFYRIVGGINFCWDYETDENILWKLADPLQIVSLDALVQEVTDPGWLEDMSDYISSETDRYASLNLAADDYHKDNISGGAPYSLEITKLPCIDARFLDEPHGTTFINYLRISFNHCGFPGVPANSVYREFVTQVKPKLKQL